MESYCTLMPLNSWVICGPENPRYETNPGMPGDAAAFIPGTLASM